MATTPLPSPNETSRIREMGALDARVAKKRRMNAIEQGKKGIGLDYPLRYVKKYAAGVDRMFAKSDGFVQGVVPDSDDEAAPAFQGIMVKEICDVCDKIGLKFDDIDCFEVFCGYDAFQYMPKIFLNDKNGNRKATISNQLKPNEWKLLRHYS